MGLSGASLASLLLFHTEDFWFRLGLLTPSKHVVIGESKLRQAQTLDDIHHDNDENDIKKAKRQSFAKLTSRFRPQTSALKTIGEEGASSESVARISPAAEVENDLKSKPDADHGSRIPKKLLVLRRARSQKRNGSALPN